MISSPNLASQMKRSRPETIVAVLQSSSADLSHYLRDLKDLDHHIISVNSLAFGEPRRIYDELKTLMGIA